MPVLRPVAVFEMRRTPCLAVDGDGDAGHAAGNRIAVLAHQREYAADGRVGGGILYAIHLADGGRQGGVDHVVCCGGGVGIRIHRRGFVIMLFLAAAHVHIVVGVGRHHLVDLIVQHFTETERSDHERDAKGDGDDRQKES